MADKSLTVFEALSAVMEEVQAVGKGDRNNEQGYNFRGIDAVVNAVGPVFRKHGVIALPVKCTANYRDVLTSREKRSRECTVSVTYRFYGPAGDFIDCEVPGESMDFGDKGAPKAMSVAYRIALLQTLCIPTHDPEPDSQSYERGSVEVETEAQEITASEFADEIANATTQEQIADIGARVKASLDAERITRWRYERLGRAAVSKVQSIGGGRDSASSNSNGSGAQPGPAGEGTRPDSAGAGDGRPGRDGEAGRSRPGVQPGVHRGAGVGGSAQTPGDHRDTPAATGGRRG